MCHSWDFPAPGGNHPQTVNDIVDHIVARVLDQFGIAAPFAKRWDGDLRAVTTNIGTASA